MDALWIRKSVAPVRTQSHLPQLSSHYWDILAPQFVTSRWISCAYGLYLTSLGCVSCVIVTVFWCLHRRTGGGDKGQLFFRWQWKHVFCPCIIAPDINSISKNKEMRHLFDGQVGVLLPFVIISPVKNGSKRFKTFKVEWFLKWNQNVKMKIFSKKEKKKYIYIYVYKSTISSLIERVMNIRRGSSKCS